MDKTTSHIRNHLLESFGVPVGPVLNRVPSLGQLRAGQWSERFERLRLNRMVMGAFRYGLLDEQRRISVYDNIGSAIERLEAYRKTGNQEHLVDAANLCMIEFETGRHPSQHFRSVDDGIHAKKTPLAKENTDG